MNIKKPNNIGISFLQSGLDRLEQYLEDYSETLEGVLRETVKSTLIAGGKRVRPSLFLICARNENYDIDYLLPAAASIEIIHTASLIHDDIIDKSILRRGKRTIHNTYDKDTAKFVGDYLFTHTFSLLNSYSNPGILEEMSKAAQLLVKGEFDQLKTKKDFYQNEKIYFEKIFEKTSSLFKVSCALGGILSGSSQTDIKNMEKFGEYIGISFQINDDLIDVDINNSPDGVGKPVGNDIKQGDITLPFIYAFNDISFRSQIKALMRKDSFSDIDMKSILKLLTDTGAIAKTREKFYSYLGMARETAGLINGAERKEGLIKVCDFIMQESEKEVCMAPVLKAGI
jgi:heptaprenyl diphosphate synthase